MGNSYCEFLWRKSIATQRNRRRYRLLAPPQETLQIKDHCLRWAVGLAVFPKQSSLQGTQIWWNPMPWHYSDRFGSMGLNSDRGTGVWQWPSVFSCWLSISRRLLDRIPSDISGFLSRLVCVCVWMWLGRKYPSIVIWERSKETPV